jgi:hypothetical protein
MEGKWEDLYRQHLYLYVNYYSLFFVVLPLVDCLGYRKWRGSGRICTANTSKLLRRGVNWRRQRTTVGSRHKRKFNFILLN